MRIKATITFVLFSVVALKMAGQILPEFTAAIKPGSPPGYYFLSVSQPPARVLWESPPVWNMIFDEKGELIYYRKFGNDQKVTNFQLHQNGQMSYFHQRRFLLMDSAFTLVDSVYCRNNYQTDHHELIIRENGNYVMLGTETFTADLRSHKVFNHMGSMGSATAQVISGIIQETDQEGKVLFEWRARDHYTFSDVDTFFLSDPTKVDWTHFNSLSLTDDGHLLVGVRHFNEVTKISRSSGEIIWRLGGKNNQFRFLNDKEGFVGQHDCRIRQGRLSVFDNGRPGKILHALSLKEYRLNETKMTATLTYNFKPGLHHSTKGLGNFQRINGRLLINYGNNSHINDLFSVLGKDGKSVLNVVFADTLRSYRVYHYPGLPFRIKRPLISEIKEHGHVLLQAEEGHRTYLWSTGETSREIRIKEPGKYKVWVQANTGFVSSEVKIVREIKGKE